MCVCVFLQIGNNLKYWPDNHDVVSKTLQLFLDMASGYSSSKMLLGLDTVKFLMRNHTEEFFPFLVSRTLRWLVASPGLLLYDLLDVCVCLCCWRWIHGWVASASASLSFCVVLCVSFPLQCGCRTVDSLPGVRGRITRTFVCTPVALWSTRCCVCGALFMMLRTR